MGNKNILLIMTDQHRNDFVGYMPNSKMTTPNIDRIAREGTGFTACQSVNPICTPARSALLTGRYPRQIGMLTMSGDLNPQIPTHVQALQQHGYTTYGVGKFHYQQAWKFGSAMHTGLNLVKHEEQQKQYGYGALWEVSGKSLLLNNYCSYAKYLDDLGLYSNMESYVISTGVNSDYPSHNFDRAEPSPVDEEHYIDRVIGRKAREYITTHDGAKPFYMMVSFCSPHRPYDPPKRYLDMFPLEDKEDYVLQKGETLTREERDNLNRQIRAYKAMIALVDDEVGMLLDTLERQGIMEDTLIVFTSDHGDMQGDHYRLQKAFPWKQCTTVPLAIRLPGHSPQELVTAPVELTDATATMLDYAGLNPVDALSRDWPAYNNIIPCRSLLPIVRGEVAKVREYSFTQTDYTEEQEFKSLKDSGSVGSEVQRKRERPRPERAQRWQMLQSEDYKYIKYLRYQEAGIFHEELYYLKDDPDELIDISKEPERQSVMEYFRRELMKIVDSTPPAQLAWSSVESWLPQ
jgi:arylsulfatase A-like enzyme